MQYDIVFLQGAGVEALTEEKPIVEQLAKALGNDATVYHPALPDADNPTFANWEPAIAAAIRRGSRPFIVIGHSLGGSILLQHLTDTPAPANLLGIILMGVPYWGESGGEFEEYQLKANAGEKLRSLQNVYIYHGEKEEVVEFSHVQKYQALLPGAVLRRIKNGDHSYVAAVDQLVKDIQSLIQTNK